MEQPPRYSLFFIKESPHFDEGTLIELEGTLVSCASFDPMFGQKLNTIPDADHEVFGYRLPDRGDGIPGFVRDGDVIPCPPFAENVPPGCCSVKITYQRVFSDSDPLFDDNPTNIGISGITIDKNLHWQKLVVPLPDKFPEITSVSLRNTLKNVEIDSYESPRLEQLDSGKAYCLHIGHIGPGFYEMDMRLGRGRFVRIRFIKLFPAEFNDRYESVKNAAINSEPLTRPPEMLPVNLYHSHPDVLEFPIEMMNHALEFATEWGPNFRKPIHERMRTIYPALADDEIDRLKAIADEAELFILALAERELAGEVTEHEIVPLAQESFPWVNENQLIRIKGIGMYWARK